MESWRASMHQLVSFVPGKLVKSCLFRAGNNMLTMAVKSFSQSYIAAESYSLVQLLLVLVTAVLHPL